MAHQPGFWDVEYRLQELSRQGDPLEKLAATVDFELFRPTLRLAQQRRTIGKGGRPPFDPVLKFKMLVLQSMHGLPLEQTEFMVRDRLSWMRFCGLGPGDRVPDKPARAAQKDTQARWTVKFSKAKPAGDGRQPVDIAIPVFGYKLHISIDRRHGVVRRRKLTDAAAHDGARLREGLIDPNNTAAGVWADTAYQSRANRAYLDERGKVSRIHRK